MKATASRKKNQSSSSAAGSAGKVAWYSILACIVALPIAVSITRSASGAAIGFTDDVYNIPKLLLLAVLASAATGAWALDVMSGRRELRGGRVLVALGVFSVLVLASTALGLLPLSSLFGASGLSTGAITWLTCLWVGVLIGQYLTSTTALVQVSWATVAGCTAAGLIAVLQSAGMDLLGTPLSEDNIWMVSRGASTLGNPNYTGLLLIVPVVVAVALGFSARRDSVKYTAAACALVMSSAIFVSLTRAAWLGLVVGLTMLVLTLPKAREVAKRRAGALAGASAGVVLLGVLLVGPQHLAGRVTSLSRGLDAFSSGRLTIWGDTLRAIANRPLQGTGADQLALGIYKVQTFVVAEGTTRNIIQDPHSLPLLLAGIFGVPALIAFATFAGIVLYRGVLLVRQQPSVSEKGVLYAAWVAGGVGYLVASLLSVYTISSVFMLFLALGVVASPMLRPVEGPTTKTVSAILALALVSATLFGAVQGFRSSRQVVVSLKGDSQFHLEEAIRLVPWDTRTRVTYQWRKISAFRDVLTGNDVAQAHEAFETLDTEIKLQIQSSPRELLWHRMRVDLHQIAKGAPAYQPDKILEAIDDALRAFPRDPEFLQMREAAVAGTL